MDRSLNRFSAWLLILLLLMTGNWLTASSALAAAPNPAFAKAQKDAEAKGYIFVASHDELVSRAKKEGKLRVIIMPAHKEDGCPGREWIGAGTDRNR